MAADVVSGIWMLVAAGSLVCMWHHRRRAELRSFEMSMDLLRSELLAPINGSSGRVSPGRAFATRRRAQIVRITYIPAALLLSVGVATGGPRLMASGVVLANLGTLYRVALRRSSLLRLRTSAVASTPVVPPRLWQRALPELDVAA